MVSQNGRTYVVGKSGLAADAPSYAVPINLYSDIEGGGGGGETWETLPGKPAVIAAGADQATARAAIGAGTSSLVVGTSASQAKAGNYTPAWGDVTGKPATFPPSQHSATLVTVTADASSGLVSGDLQQVLISQSLLIKDLIARVTALESNP